MAAYTTIDDPEAFFQVLAYQGGDATGQDFVLGGDTDMQPDMVWIKARNADEAHCIFDSVRGVTKVIYPTNYNDEDTIAGGLTAFNSDGFEVGSDGKTGGTYTYIAFCWKAGTTGSGTTGGGGSGQAYSFSVNTTSGISITQYEGNGSDGHTIPHTLGAVPTVVWAKNRDGNNGWFCMQPNGTADPWTDFAYLDLTTAWADEDTAWSDEEPTSSVVTLGNAGSSNTNANTYMLYSWTPIQGYSKFGYYEGNGNADGTFVYTGFRPAWVMTKSVDSTSSWHVFDNKRLGYNPDNDAQVAEGNTSDATTDMIDLLSNGFKFRIATDPNVAETYSYMAFAEAPLVNSNGVPNNAR